MSLGELGKNVYHQPPYAHEEDGDQDRNGPRGDIHTPKESPIATIRLRTVSKQPGQGKNEVGTYPAQPVIAENFRGKEPNNEFASEQGPNKVGNLWWYLAIVFCQERNQQSKNRQRLKNAPGRPLKIQTMKTRLMIASGQRMSTIHHGVFESGVAPFSREPQYHNAVTQICCEPCTMHARIVQTSVAAPASSPKLRPKNKKAAADAIA